MAQQGAGGEALGEHRGPNCRLLEENRSKFRPRKQPVLTQTRCGQLLTSRSLIRIAKLLGFFMIILASRPCAARSEVGFDPLFVGTAV